MGSKLTVIELKQQILRRDAHIRQLRVDYKQLEDVFKKEQEERIRLRHRVKCIEPENLNCQCPQACDGFND